MQDLPKQLLDKIHKRAYILKGQVRTVLDYTCIVTNGNGIIALDTIGYQIPIRKSRLIPRQEQIVYDMVKDKQEEIFKVPTKRYEKEHHILSMRPELFFGLTRIERQLKQVLMITLVQFLKTIIN